MHNNTENGTFFPIIELKNLIITPRVEFDVKDESR